MASAGGSRLRGELVPPERFGMVEAGLYRSNHPVEANLPFLETLGLKTAVALSMENPMRATLSFFAATGTKLVHLGGDARGEPSRGHMSYELIKDALEIMLDATSYPLVVMSSSGTHGVGTAVGCLRRLQGWAMSAALDEYRSFAAPAARHTTEQTIEHFDLDLVAVPASTPAWYRDQCAVAAEERDWLRRRCEELRSEGLELPAYIVHYDDFECLISDPAQASQCLRDSDDD